MAIVQFKYWKLFNCIIIIPVHRTLLFTIASMEIPCPRLQYTSHTIIHIKALGWRRDLSNYSSLMLLRHINGKLFASAVYRCSSLRDRDLNLQEHTHTQQFYSPFSGTTRWVGARRKLRDFMVQGDINRGRHTDHPAAHHSIRTN